MEIRVFNIRWDVQYEDVMDIVPNDATDRKIDEIIIQTENYLPKEVFMEVKNYFCDEDIPDSKRDNLIQEYLEEEYGYPVYDFRWEVSRYSKPRSIHKRKWDDLPEEEPEEPGYDEE